MATPPASNDRLDSWKAIADYLDRDIATVRRWEKSLGLPVRRVGRGRSVFAYVSEIDRWLRTLPGDSKPAPDAPTAAPLAGWRTSFRAAGIALGVLAAIVAAAAWWVSAPSAEDGLRAAAAADGIALVGADGVERWRYRMPVTERIEFPHRQPEVIGAGRGMEVLAGISLRILPGDVTGGGELLWLTRRGNVERMFTLDDRLKFNGGTYEAPWVLSDFRADPADRRRTAVVARHLQWWPSVVTLLDDRGRRQASFVNAGWVEWLEWIAPNRILIAGTSQVRNGGMIALLDAGALDGQSPAALDSPFRCLACGDKTPLRYVVFPRSEVNRAAASPINRVTLERVAGRVIAHTLEVPIDTTMRNADALYEMSPTLDVLHASYSDRYWELHRALELEHKIDHSREDCPERAGPREFYVWEPSSGWRTVSVAN